MPIPSEAGSAGPAVSGDRAVAEPGPLEDLGTLQRELRKLVHDQLQLAALEVRLAAHSLMAMIAAAVCIGALLVMVWAGLMAAAGLSLVSVGLQPAVVLLIMTALTAGLALLLRGFISRRSGRLGLPATLRSLQPPMPGKIDSEAT